jgi:hypothetical protein
MAGVVVVMLGCVGSAPREKLFIQNRHDADIDFRAYRTYAWSPYHDASANPVFSDNPDLAARISAAVDAQLTAKGYEKTSADTANFWMAMSARVQEVTVISKLRNQRWSHAYERSLLAGGTSATEMQKMSEGTLILEVIDTASDGIVWQSQAAGVFARGDDLALALDSAVTPMLETFPPGS